MRTHKDEIIDLIEGTLTYREKKNLTDKIKTNKIYKQEYNFQKEIENYMISKFQAEEANNEYKVGKINGFVKKTINEQYSENSPDFEILDFITSSFNPNNNFIKNKLEKVEIDAEKTGIFDLTKLWAEEHLDDDMQKDPEIIKYIKTGFNSDKISEKEINNPFKRNRRLLYFVSSAAAAVLIFFLLNFIFNANISNEELFSDYYKTYEMIGIQIRSNSKTDIVFQEASNYYATNQFENAVLKYQEYINNDNTRVQPYFYLGLSQIETKQYKNALQTFEQILLRFDEYEIESNWYSALCFIKTGENEKAVEILKEISTIKCIYQEDAGEIIKLLK